MDELCDEMDALLDSALASYGNAPENDGLERRVLARVSERARRANSVRSLAMILSTVAALVMVFVFWRATQGTALHTQKLVWKKPDAPPSPALPVARPASVLANSPTVRRLKRAESSPKLPHFPAPSPLSAEERALVSLAAFAEHEHPEELTTLGTPIQPIQITAIDVKPIELGWNVKEKQCCEQ